MRISDWSSDVCSSDLLLVVHRQLAEPVGAHLHVGHLVGQHPVLAELEHRVAGQVAELLHGVEDVDGEALEGAVDARQAQDRVGVARGLEEERVLAELADLRSEEHTSELQSLMRISYAVFCFTKKT